MKIKSYHRIKIWPYIFRDYDIRGKYPKEINKEFAFYLGKAFIKLLGKTRAKVGIGRDNRFSSPELFKGFSEGADSEGAEIIDFGMVTTPMFYFGISRLGLDGGVMITASHNPNPYNGFKLVKEKGIPITGRGGIFWMRDYISKREIFRRKETSFKKKIIKKRIENDYLKFVLGLAKIKRGEFKSFPVALDTGNGTAGPIALRILKTAGVKVYPLFCKPDGSFPHHMPNPILKKNLKDIINLIRKKKLPLGIALDGDGDRIIFIDENGRPVSGDLITALMAEMILRKLRNKKEKIIYDVRSSNAVAEVIRKEGGVPIPFRIGHALIKERMRKDNVLFAGELSGHYYLGKNLFFEVPFFVALKIIKEMKKRNISFSHLIKPYQKYYHSGEINFNIQEKEKIIKKVKKKYSRGKISKIDGLRIDFRDWWFLLRSSHTEPVLRLVLEAKTKRLLDEKKKELSRLIKIEELGLG